MLIKGNEIPIYKVPGKAVKKLYKICRGRYRYFRAYKKLRQWKDDKNHGGRIKVAFLVQVPEVWDKEEPIFDAMVRHHRFEVTLIVVPYFNRITEKVELSYDDNYFLRKYPGCTRKAYEGNRWISLEEMKFHYVFFQRPYDDYLPTGFQSGEVVCHAKCCYVPYGFSGSDVFDEGNTNKAFFSNIYFAFLESDYMVEKLKRKFREKELGLHHILNLGYPALAQYFNIHPGNKYKTYLWTPRWSFHPINGGSNFLEYKDAFLDLAKENPNCQFIFRPHQLMFEELMRRGIMTKIDIDNYLLRMEECGIKYDRNTPIYQAFCEADVLITDFSTIIGQFFITGKPIIYCKKNIEFNQTYEKLADGIYTVKTKAELLAEVRNMMQGQDPLSGARQKIIAETLCVHKAATDRIVECIIADYDGLDCPA